MTRLSRFLTFFCLILALGAANASAQTTEFTYQGRLLDNNMLPTTNYDFQFSIFSVSANGTPIATVQRPNVTVSNGVFTVKLDFGAQFDGTARFLEIGVKPAGSAGGYQMLAPRQPITSAPYAVRSLNAANADAAVTATTATTANNALQLGGIAANQYIITTDARLSNARNPLSGSSNYIQNTTGTQTADFRISGTGSADILSADTQYNLDGNRILCCANSSNLFAGNQAGRFNTSGTENSFFGFAAGFSNTTGFGNVFIGNSAGSANKTGAVNVFIGDLAGSENTNGDGNVFIGAGAGYNNTTGINNTMLGSGTGLGSGNLTYATVIGAQSVVTTSNTIVLGRSDGSDTVVIPGKLEVDTLGTAGATQLCLNGANRIAPCSSSLRYKTNVAPFSAGLNLVNRLQPITFDWKDSNKPDLGLGAEDVAKIEPLLVTYNKAGEIEGVKYDRVAVVLLNAVKEQQTQIDEQRKQIELQQKQIQMLKQMFCQTNSAAEICKEEK